MILENILKNKVNHNGEVEPLCSTNCAESCFVQYYELNFEFKH